MDRLDRWPLPSKIAVKPDGEGPQLGIKTDKENARRKHAEKARNEQFDADDKTKEDSHSTTNIGYKKF